MIGGYTTATSGRVTVAGYDMATHHTQAARRIGYLPERPPLYDTLDVASYLKWLFAMVEARSKSFHNRLLCAFDGCVHFADHKPYAESA
jgi:ABC-2 type transport system ATP-binding protein